MYVVVVYIQDVSKVTEMTFRKRLSKRTKTILKYLLRQKYKRNVENVDPRQLYKHECV